MSLFVGSTEFSGAYVGSSAVDAIYLGSTKVWPLATVITITGHSAYQTFTYGVALAGSSNGQFNTGSVSPAANAGTITDPGSWMPTGPTSGVTAWEINKLAANSGTLNFYLKNANDSTVATNSTHWNNVTRDEIAWPLGNVVFSANADGTGNPITIVPSDWNTQSAGSLKTTSYTSQMGFTISSGSEPMTSLNTDYFTTNAPATYYMTIYPA